MTYAELRCRTYFSFLRGASSPAELVDRAAELGLNALAITDWDGVYGVPKAYLAAKQKPALKLLIGAELSLKDLPSLTLIAQDRQAYGLMCRILTASHANAPKGEAALPWEEFLSLLELPGASGLIALSSEGDPDGPVLDYGTLRDLFAERLYIPLSRFLDESDGARTRRALELAHRFGAKLVATNDVHYHLPTRRRLQDAFASLREKATLAEAGFHLFSNSERHLKSPREMARLFRDLPEALANTLEVAERCHFCPSELRYRYPSEWIPAGETARIYLERLVWEGARERYGGEIPSDVRAQLEHELGLIAELKFSDYFLTIWEIVEFARERKILCQGRGSAANSAVCYCLGITAIDPVRMNLLFERFISAERGEPPDIDVDFEHERREEVIQHIYEKYGRHRAAMVSAVITYRSRMAIRELTRVHQPAFPLDAALIEELKGFPRHLSIHSGGFTLSADPIVEIVPVEPARMEGRTIIQWDKYDLDILGLLKVDILSLGMLSALRKTLDAVPGLTLATIPPEDPETYEMIRRADTIGTFQIESRAQMSMLPRLLPRTFYDLVIEVALVRPGPIVGKMVHPYLKRRRGLEPVALPDPRLEPILGKTLGVPLFQEQVMKIAITLAQFTPGEADELRRAIGAWRSSGSVDKMGKKLMQGLQAQGIPQAFSDLIFSQIQGFAEYGFPESHAASFALLAYASAYLKRHYPAEFTCALLNSQPMGFYAPHTLVDDAKRHGVQVLPLDPNVSTWDCALEGGALRLGWRYVHGIRRAEVDHLLARRAERPFVSLADFLNRAPLRTNVLHRLALGDAFVGFGLERRQALWEILELEPALRASETQISLFSGEERIAHSGIFSPMSEYQAICQDYSTYGLSTRGHPMQAIRAKLQGIPRTTTAQARAAPHGRVVRIAGLSIVMQRPPTAQGTVFATLEDEFGFLDLIFHQKVFEKFQEVILEHSFLIIQGRIQRDGESVSMLVMTLREMFATASLVQAYLSESLEELRSEQRQHRPPALERG